MSSTIDIQLTAPVNLRDLGGIPITGGMLRVGFAIRSDDLSLITGDAARDLVDGGLVAVIDLRTNDEVAITGRGPLAGHHVAYHHLALVASVLSDAPDQRPVELEHAAMGEAYAYTFESASSQLAIALSIIALAPGAIAFHCAAGRDRTGVLAAALLLALGAGDDDIVADYARTGANTTAILQRLRPTSAGLWARVGMNIDEMNQELMSNKEPMDVSMRVLLARLRERHGDALAPLRAAGLTDDIIARLRQRALGA